MAAVLSLMVWFTLLCFGAIAVLLMPGAISHVDVSDYVSLALIGTLIISLGFSINER